MFIPKNIEAFFENTVGLCTADRMERIQRSAFFRNLYLTGDQDGDSAIFNKTFDAIEDLCSYLCSSVDLRYSVSFPGGGSAVQRAQGQAASEELLDESRKTHLDTMFEEATLWALIDGKTFIKHGWSVDGLEPYLVMSASMGVLRPDLTDLEHQEAFVHSTYVTRDQLRLLLAKHPDGPKIYKKAVNFSVQTKSGDMPDQATLLKQVLVGGFQPYKGVGGVGSATAVKGNGMAQWLNGPYPTFSPQVIAELIRIDELWVKDDQRRDADGRREWTTIQGVGNVILFGKEQHMNIFADAFDANNTDVARQPFDDNPLAFKQPFVEFCPNVLKGYFWGRSEIANTALLQRSLNNRVNGINGLLRLQEDPPISFLGGMAKDDYAVNKLKKPGGWMHDADPTAKPPTVLAPDLPDGLWESLQQIERMFDVMTGMTPTLQGMASPSVRSHGQTGQLTTNATPRFKKKALRCERAIQSSAGLLLDLLRAKSTKLLTAWVAPGPAMPPEMAAKPLDPSVEPPAPGMKPFQFYLYELPEDVRVMVDAHSSSPAFGDETEQKAILLRKAQAMSTEQFIEQINPPNAPAVIAEARTAEAMAALAAAAQQKADAAAGAQGGKPAKK